MRRRASILAAVLCFGCALVVGCSPAVQPPQGTTFETGTNVPDSTWDAILQGAQRGLDLKTYMIMTTANLDQGQNHSTFSAYGKINPPDKADMGFTEASDYVQFYQQGSVAYFKDNGRWSQTAALTNLNVFQSYVDVIAAAQKKTIQLQQLTKQYVVNEWCNVYRATLPADIAARTPDWMSQSVPPQTGSVQYTFYVGKQDGYLRRVDTLSVSGLQKIGAFQADTQTVLFNFDQDFSKVKLPKDLIKELENSVN